jgi:hypothetical protein
MPVEFDQFAVPIERRPAGLTAHPAAAAAVRGAKPAKTQCGGWYYLHKT